MKLQESEQRLGLLKLSDTTDAAAAKRSKLKCFHFITDFKSVDETVKIILVIVIGESKASGHPFISD